METPPIVATLRNILPKDLCYLIARLAAPHAPPSITTTYRLYRDPGYEQLQISFNGAFAIPIINEQGQRPGVQHITEYSPTTPFATRGLTSLGMAESECSREIVLKTSWIRQAGAEIHTSYVSGGVGTHLSEYVRYGEPKVRKKKGKFALFKVRQANPLPRDLSKRKSGWCSWKTYSIGHNGNLNDNSSLYRATDTLFTSRNYRRWILTIKDDPKWIDESFKLNRVSAKNMPNNKKGNHWWWIDGRGVICFKIKKLLNRKIN